MFYLDGESKNPGKSIKYVIDILDSKVRKLKRSIRHGFIEQDFTKSQ